jgi:hypothetical protein
MREVAPTEILIAAPIERLSRAFVAALRWGPSADGAPVDASEMVVLANPAEDAQCDVGVSGIGFDRGEGPGEPDGLSLLISAARRSAVSGLSRYCHEDDASCSGEAIVAVPLLLLLRCYRPARRPVLVGWFE